MTRPVFDRRIGFGGPRGRCAALLTLLALAIVPVGAPQADGLTGEIKLTRLTWFTNGHDLNDSGLSSLFLRDIEINSLAIDTYVGYRFDHNCCLSTAVGFLYGRGMTQTEIQDFGMGSRYKFKSWFGLGYKGIYSILERPALDVFWHLSLIDFNLDSERFVEGSEDPPIRANGTFTGWGYGLGFAITQFMVSYNLYSVNLGLCSTCDNADFQTISIGWQFQY